MGKEETKERKIIDSLLENMLKFFHLNDIAKISGEEGSYYITMYHCNNDRLFYELKIDDCKDTINYIPNLLLDLANWFEDIMNGDYSWFTIRFMFNEDAQRIYNESDYNYKCILNNKLDKNNKLIYFFSKCFN